MSGGPLLSPEALVEALLFAAPQPVPVEQLAALLQLSLEEMEAVLGRLEAQLEDRGIRLQRHRDGVQLTTAPEAAPWIERLAGTEVTLRLSQAALETLAIIAYAQPITRPQIEAIRGVGSDGVVRTLLNAGLIAEVGRAETVGRPILYGTTAEFLQHFGLSSLRELPPLEKS